MRQVILYIAASMDNYIAKSDGDTYWLHDPEFDSKDEDYGYNALMKSIDTTLMGNATYEVVMGFDVPFPYPDTINYVFSRKNGAQETEHVKFVSEDPVSFVQQLKKNQGKDIWLIGGGQINTLLLNANLVDRVILTIAPLTLGEGIPLFASGLGFHKFKVEETKSYSSGLVQITYARR